MKWLQVSIPATADTSEYFRPNSTNDPLARRPSPAGEADRGRLSGGRTPRLEGRRQLFGLDIL